MKQLRRKDLIAATKTAIADHEDLTLSQRRRLLKTARTTRRFAVGEWYNSEAKCGCLVGEAYPELLVEEFGSFDIAMDNEETYWALTSAGQAVDEYVRGVKGLPPYDSGYALSVVDR